MEKKLKINFILKGIAVFAFVAFCLLAILAGVTLPFVSNASTVDSAVLSADSDCAIASANSDFNYLDYSIPLSQCNTTDTYYGFYFTDDFINFLRNADLVVNGSYIFAVFDFINVTDDSVMLLATAQSMGSGKFNYVLLNSTRVQLYGLSADTTMYSPSIYISENGFKFSSFGAIIPEQDIYNSVKNSIYVFNQLPFGGDTTELENQIATLTAEKNALQAQLTEKQNLIDTLTAEKNALQTQVNNLTSDKAALQAQLTEKQNQIDTLTAEKNALQNQLSNMNFMSRFGFVGTMPSSNLFLNLQEKPILPDSLRTIKDSNSNLVNGWLFHDNAYWLPLINAYDGFGNPVDGGFTGWNVFNLEYNSSGELISQPQLNFWFDNLTFTTDINVNIVDGVLSVPDFTNMNYRYESNFSNSDNLLVYASLNKSYKYYLQPSITQNDVYKFFALIDYRNYKPLDNDFYVAGYNSASSGYYDTGYKNGYAVGNTDGYNNGFSAGDSKGYQRGLNDANNYTFFSLFGAIFDAPIQALFGGTQRLPAGTKITDSSGKTITLTSDTVVNRGGLLNFELMGVNLSGFVLALFSLSIIIIVIKFALAKK